MSWVARNCNQLRYHPIDYTTVHPTGPSPNNSPVAQIGDGRPPRGVPASPADSCQIHTVGLAPRQIAIFSSVHLSSLFFPSRVTNKEAKYVSQAPWISSVGTCYTSRLLSRPFPVVFQLDMHEGPYVLTFVTSALQPRRSSPFRRAQESVNMPSGYPRRRKPIPG